MNNLNETRKNNRFYMSFAPSKNNPTARPSKKVKETAKKMIVAASNGKKHVYYICLEHTSFGNWYPNCQNQDVNFDLIFEISE